MKSYHQYCALARGLDVIGDRWTLLIARELLVAPRRYSELLDGLPGIATNLLVERLRNLEVHDVVMRTQDGRYCLTQWGQGLAEPIYALARWAAPLITAPIGDDEFRSSWLGLPVAVLFEGIDLCRPDVSIEVRSTGSPISIVSRDGIVRTEFGPALSPDLVLDGPPEAIIAVLAGLIDEGAARDRGLSIAGDFGVLSILRSSPLPAIELAN